MFPQCEQGYPLGEYLPGTTAPGGPAHDDPPKPPPVACKVGAWTDWTKCDKPCGPGKKTRTREVAVAAKHGGLCRDSLTEMESCTLVNCPVDCKVGDWGEWQICKQGIQYRERPILSMANDYGKGCPDVKEERVCPAASPTL